MIINKTTQYALLAAVYIARKENRRYFPVKEIAEECGISAYFLGKIMNTLQQEKLIESYKGPNGGVKLSSPPDKVSLLDIIHAIEGTGFLKGCFIGLPVCGGKEKCMVHDEWEPVKNSLLELLKNKTLHDMSRDHS